jgi:hypothetical protein
MRRLLRRYSQGRVMAAEKKTRGPRKKRPPVMWPVPTQEGLSGLQCELRQLARQHPSQHDQMIFKFADDVLDLLLQTRPWRTMDRDEIERGRWYFLEMELIPRASMEPSQRKTDDEICKAVAKKLKDTVYGGVSADTLKKFYCRIKRGIETGDRERPWWWPPLGI